MSSELAQLPATRSSAFRIPVLAAIAPLESLRHAEFMANEVPGVRVPDAIVERMRARGRGGARGGRRAGDRAGDRG